MTWRIDYPCDNCKKKGLTQLWEWREKLYCQDCFAEASALDYQEYLEEENTDVSDYQDWWSKEGK
jgi:hypothetical protein